MTTDKFNDLILGEPRHLFKHRLAFWLNTMSSDNPLYKKAQSVLSYLARQDKEKIERRIFEQNWLNQIKI